MSCSCAFVVCAGRCTTCGTFPIYNVPSNLPAVPAAQVLPRALRHMLAKSDEKTRAAVNKVIRVWDERKVRPAGWRWLGVRSSCMQQGRVACNGQG